MEEGGRKDMGVGRKMSFESKGQNKIQLRSAHTWPRIYCRFQCTVPIQQADLHPPGCLASERERVNASTVVTTKILL